MKIDPTTQLWHCFGCGEGGDIFTYVMKLQDMSFPEALRFLADRAHIELASTRRDGISQSRRGRLKAVCAASAEFFHMQLMRSTAPEAASARQYLASRGFGGDVPKVWNLGFAPGRGSLVHHLTSLGFTPDEMVQANVAVQRRGDTRINDRFFGRVVFPINDAQGECIAFGARIIGEGQPKYLNSQETPIFHKSQVLFGLDKAKAAMASTGTAIVVEGYTDVIALSQAGIKNVVATLGTALTMQHIRILSRHAGKRIVYLFDGDAAGQRAADRALQFINYDITPEAGKSKIEICAVTLPDNADPAEYVANAGAESLKGLLAEARPLLEYGIKRRIAAHDIASAEGRSAALTDALSILAPIKDSVLAKDYAARIAGEVHVREQDALLRLARMQAAPAASEASEYGATGGKEQTSQSGRNGRASILKNIPKSERNRLSVEREFLGLCAQNPILALEHVNTLTKTRWHDRAHSVIADALVSILQDDLCADAASVISKIGNIEGCASSVLTAANVPEGSSASSTVGFLARELEIGDGEELMLELKLRLASENSAQGAGEGGEPISDELEESLFEQLISLQTRLTELRRMQKQNRD